MTRSARCSPPRYSSKSGNPDIIGIPPGSSEAAMSACSWRYWSYMSFSETKSRDCPAPLTVNRASSACRMVASTSSVSA